MSGIRRNAFLRRVLPFAAVLLLCGCKPEKAITIGASVADGSALVCEIYAQALEHAGYRVTRNYDAADSNALEYLLRRGEIDLYAAYEPAEIPVVSTGGPPVELLESVPADSAWGLAVLRSTAESQGLSTLEDLREKAGELVLASTREFLEDPEGFARLREVYGPFEFRDIVTVTADDLHMPFHMEKVDVIPLRGDDGHLADPMHRLLADSLHAAGKRHLVPVVKQDYSGIAEVREILNRVSAFLGNGELIALNNWVAVQGTPPPEAARDFLERRGFIK